MALRTKATWFCLLSSAALVLQEAPLLCRAEDSIDGDAATRAAKAAKAAKKPRPKAYLVREKEDGMKMQLLESDDDGNPLVNAQGELRPDLNPDDYEDEPGVVDVSVQNRDVRFPMDENEAAEFAQEQKEEQARKEEARERKKQEALRRQLELDEEDDAADAEDEDEEEDVPEGQGTISSGALKSKSKKEGASSPKGKASKPKKTLFEDRFNEAIEACKKYRETKNEGKLLEEDLQEHLDETRTIVTLFMTDSLKSYKENHTMLMRLGQLVTPPKAGEKNPFIEECYAMDAIELFSAWGWFYEDFAQIDMCLKHTKTVSEFEGRCFPSRMGSALQSYLSASDRENFDRLWSALQVTRDKQDQKPLVYWKDRMMFPRIMVPGLRNKMLWERKHSERVRHIMEILENHTDVFREDLEHLVANDLFEPVDNSLVAEGSWEKAVLFDGIWSSRTCPVALNSCSMFRYELPGRNAELPYWYENHEEVAFYRAGPGTRTLPHAGSSNGRVNIQIGIGGLEDSFLELLTGLESSETLEWKSTEAIAFNDGWQRREQTGSSERFILEVGVFHPDITPDTYLENGFNGRTLDRDYGDEMLERLRTAPRDKPKRRRHRRKSAASSYASSSSPSHTEL